MGIHTYPCPTCYATQRVKRWPGEIVTIEDCEACAQTKKATRARQRDNDEDAKKRSP